MILFFASDKPREQDLAGAFVKGAKRYGLDAEKRVLCAEPDIRGATVVAMVGVKSKRLFEATVAAGAMPLMFDKGYIRTRLPGGRVWEFWRASPGAHHPTRTSLMSEKHPSDRLDALSLTVKDWRRRGLQIVVAGSSAKYHDFYGLPEPNAYYHDLVERIRDMTDRPIVYRPKPSFKDAKPIKGTYFSRDENVMGALEGAWAMVTHGSNASFEAALMGVPSVVLGDGVGSVISSRKLEEVVEPKLGKRQQWLQNLAYHQWTEDELRSSEAFDTIGKWIDARAK